MNIRFVAKVVASLVTVIGLAMLTAVPVSWAMGDKHADTVGLLYCAVAAFAAGAVMLFATRGGGHVGFREGFGIVTFGWLAAAVFGCVPFVVVSDMHWYDAFFETMSGFTTTGASVLDDTLTLRTGHTLEAGIADLPYGLIYWRSLTHWLGGMGIVVLSVAILPSLGIGAHQLYRAEVPGPTSDQLTPKIADSAKILWAVYVLLSLLETGLLMLGGMSLFEAWCHTCGTMATGGFSTEQASVGAYDSVYIDGVITIFMFLAGVNFVLHFRALQGRFLSHFRDEEFLFYLVLTAGAILVTTMLLTGTDIATSAGDVRRNAGFFTALRYAAFQVVAILTTTGFVITDFDAWPAFCALLLICLMAVAGLSLDSFWLVLVVSVCSC